MRSLIPLGAAAEVITEVTGGSGSEASTGKNAPLIADQTSVDVRDPIGRFPRPTKRAACTVTHGLMLGPRVTTSSFGGTVANDYISARRCNSFIKCI